MWQCEPRGHCSDIPEDTTSEANQFGNTTATSGQKPVVQIGGGMRAHQARKVVGQRLGQGNRWTRLTQRLAVRSFGLIELLGGSAAESTVSAEERTGAAWVVAGRKRPRRIGGDPCGAVPSARHAHIGGRSTLRQRSLALGSLLKGRRCCVLRLPSVSGGRRRTHRNCVADVSAAHTDDSDQPEYSCVLFRG